MSQLIWRLPAPVLLRKKQEETTLARAGAERNISDVTGRESLEFPSLAPDENKFSPVDSLGNIRNVTGA